MSETKIEYKTAIIGGSCITLCPYGVKIKEIGNAEFQSLEVLQGKHEEVIKVGSWICERCKYCMKKDEDNNVVICSNLKANNAPDNPR